MVKFSLSIITTNLWESNYSEYQEYLFNRICKYKEDFLNFEWDSMKEIVSLDSDKEIVVRLMYSNKDSISSGINNFDLNYNLTESNFEEDIRTIENQIQKLNSIKFE